MRITRRSVSLGVLATGLMPFGARAQGAFPGSQTVKVIVGFPAGGSQDNVGRIVADRLAAHWGGASVVIENIAGAGSNIAFDRVAKGPADGTQILIVPPGLATNQFLYAKIAFDPEKDFVPIGLVATFPNLLCVRMTAMLAEVVGSGSREFAAFLAAERVKWGKLISDLKIRVGN